MLLSILSLLHQSFVRCAIFEINAEREKERKKDERMSNWQENHSPSIYCSVSVFTSKFSYSIFRCLNSLFSGLFRQIQVDRESTVYRESTFCYFSFTFATVFGWWFQIFGQAFSAYVRNSFTECEHWISKDYMQSKHSWLWSSANCEYVYSFSFTIFLATISFLFYDYTEYVLLVLICTWLSMFVHFWHTHTFKTEISLCHEKVNDPISCYK